MEHIVNKQILIVDDDERLLRAMDRVLSDAGARVAVRRCASEAMDFLVREWRNTDLVITDLRMPVVAGSTLVYAVGLIAPGVPVVVLTAFGNPESQMECLRDGAAGFWEKTMSSAQLLAAIDQVLAAQRIHPESSAEIR